VRSSADHDGNAVDLSFAGDWRGLIWWLKSGSPSRVRPRTAPSVQFLPCCIPITLDVAPDGAGQRLDQYLATHLSEVNRSEVSRARVQQLIAKGEVLMNGTAAKASLRLKGSGDEQITVTARRTPLRCALLPKKLRSTSSMKTTTSPSSTSPRHDGACGRGSHDDARNRGTLVNALLHHFGTLSAIGGELRPGIVHRLDRATSGLMVVAKNDESHRRLAKQSALARCTRRTSRWSTAGQAGSRTIQSPISRHSRSARG